MGAPNLTMKRKTVRVKRTENAKVAKNSTVSLMVNSTVSSNLTKNSTVSSMVNSKKRNPRRRKEREKRNPRRRVNSSKRTEKATKKPNLTMKRKRVKRTENAKVAKNSTVSLMVNSTVSSNLT